MVLINDNLFFYYLYVLDKQKIPVEAKEVVFLWYYNHLFFYLMVIKIDNQ